MNNSYEYHGINEHPSPFISLGPDLHINFANKAAYTLFNEVDYSLQELVNRWGEYINKIICNPEVHIEFETDINEIPILWKLFYCRQNKCINIYGIDIFEKKLLKLKLDEREFVLKRQVKELNCLYEISKIIDRPFISLEKIIRDITIKLHNALNNTRNTSIRISVNDIKFETEGFIETEHFINQPVSIRKENKGRIEVFLNEDTLHGKQPFLYGEIKLIGIVAKRIGKIVERLIVESELSVLNKELKVMAFYDALTGVMSRKYFSEQLNILISTYERLHRKIAVFLIDIDNFKKINDTLGHDFGDNILISVAQALKKSIRKSDFIGRLGGDEFVLSLNGIKSESEVMNVAGKIENNLGNIIVFKDEGICLKASIGIAIYPDDSINTFELFRFSDEAMYAAKKNGKGQVVLYGNIIKKS